jgi:DNA-binding NarL/FixJ family response regulator
VELVGRDHELAAAGRAVDDVRRGGQRVLGVLGEAGIGKSALMAVIAARCGAAGLKVMGARGVEHERDVPFGLAHAALVPHVVRLPQDVVLAAAPGFVGLTPAECAAFHPIVGPGERFRHYRAGRTLLEVMGRRRPFALLLDDVHWADEATVEFLLHVLRRPPEVPHLLVLAMRSVGPAARLLDAARSAPGEQLLLDRLDRDASLALLADVADASARERVAREAAGNPLYLRELARVADRPAGALPPTLVAAVEQEVAALDRSARVLLEGAAVAGDPFDPELAAATAGAAPDAAALDRLVAAGLVRPNGRGRSFAFRHPLVRRAVYDRATPAWRLAAHERAAAALERRGAAATARAYHVERAAHIGDRAAVAVLCEAAELSGGTSPADAAHWYSAALRLIPDGDRRARSGLLARHARALAAVGRLEDARDALLEALAHPGEQWIDLTVSCAHVESQLGRHADARRRLLAARAHAPVERHAGIARELAVAAFNTGDIGELRRWSETAVRAAGAGQPLTRAGAEALAAFGAQWAGEPDRAAAALDRATAGLGALDDAAIAECVPAATPVAVAQFLFERFEAASETSARALAIAHRTGQEDGLVTLLGLRALSRRCVLDLDDALQHAETADEVARLQRVPHLEHFALWLRALVHEDRGEPAEAERAVRDAERLTAGLEPSKLVRTAACDLAAIGVDDPERAIAGMTAAAGPDLEDADPTWRTLLLLRLVRFTLAAERCGDAERWAALATEHAARLRLPAGAVRAACARAEVRLARDDAARAAVLAADAVAAAARAGAPLDALDARLLAGRALAAAGDAGAAKATLQRVAADAGRGGALRYRDAAARDLRRLGSRVSAEGRRAVREDLTDRERGIAELVAAGRSNKQVAATLYLSEKTVENALTRVYAKLGVRSRTELPRTLTAA